MTSVNNYFDNVLKYVPNKVLATMLDMPVIGDQVLNLLYSTIKVGSLLESYEIKIGYGPFFDAHEVPTMKSIMEYIHLLRRYPTISPKKVDLP
ncbi:hypothetical protein Cantr_08845 [Candida viswanathii]|uniref:Uncharacterized protein n=1 Tax=Candida viswanathii TaxID=5486 RepID=A0A367YAN9_9ASCO|nr:hypothetical protein Cantr_08845 [Candida viswanathii]